MRLRKFHLIYFPPAIVLEYVQSSQIKTKTIDLLELGPNSNVEEVAREVMQKEKLITSDIFPQLHQCIKTLVNNLERDYTSGSGKRFYIYKTLQTHLLPLTNVFFDKQGKRCLTGSYDRTCKIWNIDSTNAGGDEITLEGHKNVVYSVGFNYPICDRVVTGSFDKTAKIWHAETGECLATLWGHRAEVVCAQYSPNCDLLATSSMDNTAKIFHSYTGQESGTLNIHTAEIIAVDFNRKSPHLLITGSFDTNIILWDLRINKCITTYRGHEAGISNCLFNWSCDLIASGSFDNTVRLWDVRTQKCVITFSGHTDEVLDVVFDSSGKRLSSCSSDCTARLYDVTADMKEMTVLSGHSEEVSKVCFSPGGNSILTASADTTARIWNCDTGNCTQVLSGHRGEVFSCAYSYLGDTLVTASKDNTCRVWR